MIKRLSVFLLLILVLSSCGSRKGIKYKKDKKKPLEIVKVEKDIQEETKKIETEIPTSTGLNTTQQYILNFSEIAKQEMRQYGIPASITLAQGILESASGKGRLAKEANNHFGIKCHDWRGARIYHDDDKKGECFRKYKNAKYSFQDHSVFLTSRKRYHKLFILDKDDYRGWARELRAAGYATDRKYPQKLISLIERYELYKYDAEVLGNQPQEQKTHTVVSGDTLYSLSKKYEISIEEIKRINGMDSDNLFVGQTLLIKPFSKSTN